MTEQNNYIHATIHDFKTNISRYLRYLESGAYRGIVVKRHNTPVGMFVPFKTSGDEKPDRSLEMD